MRADRYVSGDREAWNALVARSRTGTFLFDRGYLEYHSDRFEDLSLVFRDDRGDIVGLLPASRHGEAAVSHGGLTYGGVVADAELKVEAMLRVFEAMLERLRAEGVRLLVYKPVPHIFHRYPAEEDLYALFRAGARLVRRDASAAIPLPGRLPLAKGKREGIRKAMRAGVEVAPSEDFDSFFEIGRRILREKYGREPVHTPAEMRLLGGRFPAAIRLHAGLLGGRMVAGTIVYDCGVALHTQYMFSSAEGQEVGALDLVLERVMEGAGGEARWLSLGVSTEDDGRTLNGGLAGFKELFGARTVVHDFYEVDVASGAGGEGR